MQCYRLVGKDGFSALIGTETVDLWGMSARMYVQSFVALRCVLRRDFWTIRELIPRTRRRTISVFLQTTFRVQKWTLYLKYSV